MIGAYSTYQLELSDKVKHLRDVEGHTFKAIGERLADQGCRSPRGRDLSPEIIFSIYKKRKMRDLRLDASPKKDIQNVEIVRLRPGR